jgi:hypothetical protein
VTPRKDSRVRFYSDYPKIFDRFSKYENEITRFSHLIKNESVVKEYEK